MAWTFKSGGEDRVEEGPRPAGGLSAIPASSWITVGILVSGLVGTYTLMQDHVSQLRVYVGELQEEVRELQIRAATEDAADQLLQLRVERLEEDARRNGGIH